MLGRAGGILSEDLDQLFLPCFTQASQTSSGVLDSQHVVFAPQLHLGQELAVSFDNVREHPKEKPW
jgi:hypothetical protein